MPRGRPAGFMRASKPCGMHAPWLHAAHVQRGEMENSDGVPWTNARPDGGIVEPGRPSASA
ncbi:hypothetical protein K0M31_018883 [Melipona bicolor]|uniref:Uncharacterized protein n=1 Tax=Melipona bicolor TaxID=60889 RepID=A0AA40G4Q0_9HYME|nr:hypothetical protein K0M31_018883 [Melipona bicolor]